MPDDIALLQYTGGTTGKSKAAVLTHNNILSNIQQLNIWVRPHVTNGKEIIITALPLYHIFSFTVNFLGLPLVEGSTTFNPSS